MRLPTHLVHLIERFKKLPGVGSRTAERFAFHLLSSSKEECTALARLIGEITNQLQACKACGALMEKNCFFCEDQGRDRSILCIVATQREVFSFEETGQYRGLYHVLGGLFSPLEGRDLTRLRLESLLERVLSLKVDEVILALDATLEGDATALMIKEKLKEQELKITRLAFGLPQNCSLEYVDGGTLSHALKGRLKY